MTELETQILQAVADNPYNEMRVSKILLGIDAIYTVSEVFRGVSGLIDRGYLQKNYPHWARTDKGRAELKGELK